jgi:NADH-quinone oxidoreductase subunit A
MVIINYLFIAALLVMSIVFALLPIIVEAIFAPKKKGKSKSQTYECGVLTTGETWVRFRIQYFIYAIMFVVFDIETVFLYPWAVSYAGLGGFAFFEMALFLIVLMVGLVYVWATGGLKWL